MAALLQQVVAAVSFALLALWLLKRDNKRLTAVLGFEMIVATMLGGTLGLFVVFILAFVRSGKEQHQSGETVYQSDKSEKT